MDCRVDAEMSAGDHRLVTATVVAGEILRHDVSPLRYHETGTMDDSATLYPAELPAP
jgi:flavin reductase (DIM6/NTAB) family NADH-FMN oxidoreductase RutF